MQSVCGFALGAGGRSVNMGSRCRGYWAPDELDFLYGRKGRSLQSLRGLKEVQDHVQVIGKCWWLHL